VSPSSPSFQPVIHNPRRCRIGCQRSRLYSNTYSIPGCMSTSRPPTPPSRGPRYPADAHAVGYLRAPLRSLRFRPLALSSAPVAALRPASVARHRDQHPTREATATVVPSATAHAVSACRATEPSSLPQIGNWTPPKQSPTWHVRTFFTAIKSMISVCREHAGNVKRWRDGKMTELGTFSISRFMLPGISTRLVRRGFVRHVNGCAAFSPSARAIAL
jgi:hypothetical protein